jgi:hypothetical protein
MENEQNKGSEPDAPADPPTSTEKKPPIQPNDRSWRTFSEKPPKADKG